MYWVEFVSQTENIEAVVKSVVNELETHLKESLISNPWVVVDRSPIH